MEFRILGPVELWSRDRRHELGWAKERFVMAVLLMTPGRPVSVQSLINKVWDDNPPAKARALLGIGDAHQRARRHQTALKFYDQVLRIAQGIGDVHQEAQVLQQMGSALDQIGDRAQARRLWHQALELYEHLGAPEARSLRTRLHGFPEAADS
jgi:tetratricopeptide (TPR) repeat protein